MKQSWCGKDQQYELLPNTGNGNKNTGKAKWRSIFQVNRYWGILFVLAVLVFAFDYFELNSILSLEFKNIAILPTVPPPELPRSLDGYVVNTPGCRIPDMNPFDITVKEFIETPSKFSCDKINAPLFDSNATSLYMLTRSLSVYNVSNSTDLTCCYRDFIRLDAEGSGEDNRVKYSKQCQKIGQEPVNIINSEFVRVSCKNSAEKTVYDDFFAFVPVKKPKLSIPRKKLKPNILIIGLDAVSRLNLHRQMPKTHKYITENLDAIELLGYNKVADNTFVNLMPVFAGMFESELKNSCWPESRSHFDDCPFLWKNYSANNYVTAVGEDCAEIGLFYYQKYGFIKQTSDYYYTTFVREAEGTIGTDKNVNCRQCVGARDAYKLILDYVKKFTRTMHLQAAPYFGFFWSNSLSHDYLNEPGLGDESYYDLFKTLKETGALNDTILIFMSDHGIRWGGIRQTYQGQMEERLPFVIMALPEWFKSSYPQAVMNLKRNVRRLTTPFDLHETLKELLDVDNLLNPSDNSNFVSRGYSLFSNIPKTRTCKDAEIPSHWCTCQQSAAISTNDSEVISAAKFAVYHINSQLAGYAQCAILDLDDIINARVTVYKEDHITNKRSTKDYMLTLQTKPGDGIFEVTVRSRALKKKAKRNVDSVTRNKIEIEKSALDEERFNITGTISRLNLYGKQSYCVTDFHSKLYCYCTNLLNF
ncbi:unnamed protein product [Ceutorhynchus assimilis]|uniref:DUF229 domain containing protein n=1 Tax=Ceutorhynchus assimilis TaxID=467358 RepID=A0A9P0DNX3_9CUCU|nr:unnamed protein product [Ceutorhynchus assimilis]